MKVRSALTSAVQGLALAHMAVICSITLSALTLVSIALIPLGVGLITTPLAVTALRGYADYRRRLAHTWGELPIASPYRSAPAPLRGGFVGYVEQCSALLRDRATWRDLLWLQIDATAGFTTAILPFALLAEGLFGYVLAAGVWEPIVRADDTYWYTFLPVTSQDTAFLAAALGTAWIALVLGAGQAIMHGHYLVSRAFLAPTPAMELSARVRQLTETRHDAIDTSAAELRRIERDLHDGAQARLVAVGMSLGTVEALIERNPAKAKELLAAARADSAEALSELRDLVRGIHPPVLAERGLGDAVRALALRMPLPIEVDVELSGRAEEPVEAAAYFAISEVLTNAAKHSGAGRIWVDVHHADGSLRIAVTDDGRGGVDIEAGTGIRGVERRLGTFDGVLAVSSPLGGPTMVTMEIPCELRPQRI
ncbi:sensor domain-containing protein [Streptomyces sp. SAJ15]|uniref:sensor histidine kinase n=1 Tax=Streptomyces sp. SAJ15 TaxID=2011095 RepID=UPI0011862461|nr:sensor domain-containing protein [Streptomyces sp. SAJ15]TVL89922.1 sensor histidine kinase [Streptomyces sp. SAJ15]